MRDTAGSAAAPANRWRTCLRWGSFISIPPSLVSLFDHLVGARQQRCRKLRGRVLGRSSGFPAGLAPRPVLTALLLAAWFKHSEGHEPDLRPNSVPVYSG